MSSSSRLAPARRRARLLKFVSAGVAVAGFGVLSLAARNATADESGANRTPDSTSRDLAVSARIAQEAEQSDSFFQGGSVTPSTESAPPRAETRTS